MTYTLTAREFRNLKSRLTRAKNSRDSAKIMAECRHAAAIFKAKGFPDCWSTWSVAYDDAAYNFPGERDRNPFHYVY